MTRASIEFHGLAIIVTVRETLVLGEFKAHLFALVRRVKSLQDRVTVTVHGHPSAVLLSVDDLDALEETIAILSDSDPDTLRQLAASDAELARGEGETEQSLAEAMRRRGLRER